MKGSLASLESPRVITQPVFLLELRNGARCVQALCAPPTEAASRVPSSPGLFLMSGNTSKKV